MFFVYLLRFILPGAIYLYAIYLGEEHSWSKAIIFSLLLVAFYFVGYYEGIQYGLEVALQ
jgi:hypothetical protein